ncbi:MAG: hypothetical protein EOP04_07385 [Proteobacteria bacterium]|nr:MAG: hypothetical protein EOP04_07385 [Pseudomonadota bacterium]
MRLPAEMNAKRLNEILSKHLESQKSSNNQSFSISRIKFSRVSISVSLKKEGEHSYFETHYFDEKAQRHIFSSGMVSLEGRKEHAKTREFLAKFISQKALEQDLSQLNSTHFIREHATIKDTFEQIGIKYFGGKRPLIETLLPRTRTSTKDNGSFDAILYLLSAVVGFFVAAQGLQAYLQRRLGLNEGQVLVSLLSDTVRATPLTLLSHGIGAGLILAFAYRALHKPFWHFLAGVPLGLVTSLCIWTLPSMLAINERLSGSALNLSGGSIEPRVVSPTNLYLYFAISLVISLTLNELMRWRPIKWKNQGKLLIFSFHGMTSDKSSEKPWLALIENLRLGWESMLQEAFNRDHQFFASVEPRTSVSESTQTQSQSQSQSSFQKSDTPKPKAPKAEPVSSNVYKIHDEKLVVDTSKSDSPKMAKGSKWSIEQKILLREIGFDENLDRDEVFTKLVTAIADHQKYSREDLKRFGEALDKLGEYKSA